MRKYIFTVLLLVSAGIASPGIWWKLIIPEDYKEAVKAGIWAEQREPQAETETTSWTELWQTEEITEETETAESTEAEERTEETEPETESEAESETVLKSFTQVDRSYWADALFIGDSRTVGLSEYADLGEADVFADSGMSVYKAFSARVDMGDAGKQTLEEVLRARQYGKIYMMMGINELGYDYDSTVKKYGEMVAKIRELQPEAILFLEANLHVTQKKSAADKIYNNAAIDRINQAVSAMADNMGSFYIDVNELFDDGQGNLDASYTSDDAHVLGKYYADWAEWLLTKGIL